MKETYAKMTFRLILISFLAFTLIGCGESGSSSGDNGVGATAAISLQAGLDSMPADGVTSTTITAVLSDSTNAPVLERTSVKFRTTKGTFRNGKTEYRVDTADDSGSVTVTLIADDTPGTAEVWVQANNVSQKIEVKFYDPTKIGTISLRTGSASITADGSSKVSVIATVLDALGNPEEGAIVSFKTSLGQFENANYLPGILNRKTAVTDVDGEAKVMLVSGTTIGTATILASLDGLNTTASVAFTADDPTTITLRAAPSLIRPNGTSTLYATLKDANGNPVASQNVVFSQIVNASEGTLSILSDDTNVNGEAQATYTAGKDPGTDILQAAFAGDLSLKFQTSIVVDPAAIVVDSIEVTTGSASLVADGNSQVKIRAVVTDIDGNPAASKTVNFTTTAGTLVSLSDTTDENGMAEVMLRSTTIAGPVTVRGECDGFIAEAAVEFVPGPAHHIIMYALPDTVPPGGAFTTAAIVQDQYDNRIDDQRLMLQVRRAGHSEIIDTAEMTPDQAEDGVFRFDWTAATAYGEGNLEITARVNNGVSKTVTVVVDETATIVGSIELTAGAEEIKADGTSTVLIRALVLDYNGNPAQGVTVDFATTLGSLSKVQKTTDANGLADVLLRSGTDWGTATVTADANGFWGEVAVRFTSLKAGGVSITAMPGLVKPGGQAAIIAELHDANGAPVPDEVLYFDIYENNTGSSIGATCSCPSCLTSTATATTDVNGRAIIFYCAGTNVDYGCSICTCSGDRIRVTLASDSSITDTTCIKVAVSTGDVGYMTLESDASSIPADGISSTAVTAVVYDTAGFAMPEGTLITFSTTAGTFPGGEDPDDAGPITSEITLKTLDDSGKIITSLIAGTTADVAEITATCGGLSQVIYVLLDDGSVLVGSIELTAEPESIPADGASSSAITAVIKDTSNNPVPDGTPVVFTTTSGSFEYGLTTTSILLYTSGGTGTLTTALIAANTPDVAMVTVTAGSKSQSVLVTFTSDAGDKTVAGIALSTPDNTIFADGISSTTIQAIVTDTNGDPMPEGTEVTFATTAGTLSSPSVIISGDSGIAVISLISAATPGTAVVTATSGTVTQTIEILFYNPTVVGSITLEADPESIPADDMSSSTITATIRGTDGNPVPVGTLVEFQAQNGFGTLSDTALLTTDSTGVVETSLIAGLTIGVEIVRATSGTVTQSVSVAIVGQSTAEIGSISLSADKQSIPADSSSSVAITATLLDTAGEPMPQGTEVVFVTDLGTFSNTTNTITLYTANDSGTLLTALIAGATGGVAHVTATSGGISQALNIIIDSGSVIVGQINLTVTPGTLPADGTSSAVIRAEVLDSSGDPVPQGTDVVFTTDLGTFYDGTTSLALATANELGLVYTSLVSDTTPGVATIVVTSGLLTQAITISIVDSTAALIGSVSLDSTLNAIPADGSSSTAVTATLLDTAGDPMPQGTEVVFTTDLGEFPNGSNTITVYTSGNSGTVTTSLIADTTAGVAEIIAECDGVTQVLNIVMYDNAGAAAVGAITLESELASIPADGSTSTAITATVLDSYGNPVANGTDVVITTSLGTLPGGMSITLVTSGGTGQVLTSLIAGTSPGTAIIEATAGDVTQSIQVTIRSVDVPVADTLYISTSKTSIKTNGTDAATITALVLDVNAVPIEGASVSFSATGGMVSSGSVVTDASGEASVTLTSGPNKTNGTVTVTASADGITASVPVLLYGTTITLTPASAQISTGGPPYAEQEIILKAVDADGLPIYNETIDIDFSFDTTNPTGATLSFETESGPVTLNIGDADTAPTNYVGQIVLTLTAADTAGTAVITVDGLGMSPAATGTYTLGASTTIFEITAPADSPHSAPADGGNVLVTVHTGTLPAGQNVVFITSFGTWAESGTKTYVYNTLSSPESVSANLRSTQAGVATVQVYAANTTLYPTMTDQTLISFYTPASQAYDIRMDSSASNLPPSTGLDYSLVVEAQVVDIYGGPVGGATVDFYLTNTTGGGEYISPVSAVTDATGIARTTFTSGVLSTGSDPGSAVRVTGRVATPSGCSNEVTEITCTTDTTGLTNSDYFTLSQTTGDYYVWYDIGNTNTPPAGPPPGTGIEVELTAGASQCAVTYATEDAVDAVAGFDAYSLETEITTITCVGDTSESLLSTYFVISSRTTDYYVWYYMNHSIAVASSYDPAPAGRTGIRVDILEDDTANSVAQKTMSTLNAMAGFNASVATNTVTVTTTGPVLNPAADVSAGHAITNAQVCTLFVETCGDVTDAANGTASPGFTFYVANQGEDVTHREDHVDITITGGIANVSIGAASVISASDDNTLYLLPVSVLVSDTNGNPVSGAVVSLGLKPSRFRTGYWYEDLLYGWLVEYENPYDATDTYLFVNEDLNNNSILDNNEDKVYRYSPPYSDFPVYFDGYDSGTQVPGLGNGVLTPGQSVAGSIPASVTTDEFGVAGFTLTYQKEYGVWVEDQISATVMVFGTEYITQYRTWLPILADEKEIIANAFPTSPFNDLPPGTVP